jgi:hypothetical protein
VTTGDESQAAVVYLFTLGIGGTTARLLEVRHWRRGRQMSGTTQRELLSASGDAQACPAIR